MLQRKKLVQLVNYAYSHVPYYRNLFDDEGLEPSHIRSLEDLHRIPITTKETLRKLEPEQRIGNDYSEGTLIQEKTSGSTGEPFRTYFDPSFISTRDALFLRALHVAGYRPGMKLMLVTANDTKSRSYLRWRYASIRSSAEDLIAQLDSFRPSVLYGCMTPLRIMAEHVKASKRKHHKPDIVISTAESMDDRTRLLLQRVFDADVYDIYGLTESGMIAWECNAHDGYHLSEDTAIIETIADPDRNAERLIVTNLELKAMPMIRFQTDDLAATIARTDCACGRTLRRLRRIEGRLVDCLTLADGEIVTPYRVTMSLEEIVGLERYQVIQTDSRHFTVRAEADPQVRSKLVPAVQTAMSDLVGRNAEVDVQFDSSIAPSSGQKFRVVANRITSNCR